MKVHRFKLNWAGPNPVNTIHSSFLIPDTEALIIPNEVEISTPIEFSLDQNYPNPFNPSTQIGFNLPKAGEATLRVFNVVGQTVQVLVNGNLNQGVHNVSFDASGLSSGVYFYQLEFDGKVLSNKMLLMK